MRVQAARPEAQLRAITAAAVIAQVFTVYVVVLAFAAPATEAQWAQADPILRIGPRALSQWLVPGLAIGVVLMWWRIAPPPTSELRRAAFHAALGAVAATTAVVVLRLLAGPTLPAFVPSEESAGPGYLLGMSAGYGEELLFRFLLLSAVWYALSRRLRRPVAIAVAALVTGLAFALLHAAGPGEFEVRYFVTRLLVPGAAMSVVFLAISPAFLVGAHCTAHIVLPVFFASPGG